MSLNNTPGNLNETRAYPFVDTASLIADSGNRLPEFVINDIHIWWPDHYGKKAYLSALTISQYYITLTVCAVSDTNDVTPIGVFTVTRPYTKYASYPLIPIVPGASGWVAFGDVTNVAQPVSTWLFSTASNSTLLPRVAQAYESLPVSSISKANAVTKLVNNVGLLGGQNIEITYEKRNIEGTVKDCIVFGLAKSNLPDLYATFAGPCGNRPESNTCDRQPIRRINDVDPDLYGIITLIVDDSSGIITGSTEIVSSELVGVQLDTPVSFDDICTKTAAFPTTYDDLCYPQTHPEPQPHTSSSAVGYSSSAVGMSSSVPVSKTYMFDDALELNDWVAFAGTGSTYIQNWNVTALDAFNSTTALKLRNSQFEVPFPRNSVTDNIRLFKSNKYRADLSAVGNSVSMDTYYDLLITDLEQLEYGDSASYNVILEASAKESEDADTTKWRIRANYSREESGQFKVVLSFDVLYGSAWSSFPISTSYFGDVLTLQSSSVTTHHSSSGAVELQEQLGITITKTGTGPDLYDIVARYNGTTATVSFDTSAYTGQPVDFANITFIGFGVRTDNTAAPVAAMPVVTAYFKSVALTGDLVEQECNDDNFTTDNRAPYKLDYVPADGWSNDFGVTRAINQLRYAGSVDAIVPKQVSADVNGSLVYTHQYLQFLNTVDHKYAILKCENSVVNNYLISAAFRYVSGSPKVGLMLGWQEDSGDKFWAIMIDLLNRRISYGMHYIGHNFQIQSWIPISGITDPDWSYNWHRLVVQVSGPAPYSVKSWIDPTAVELSSSSQTAHKRIYVDAMSPDYTVVGKSEWNGVSVSTSQFADGPPGLYVYGGEALAAELTVSPVDSDIVVPDKCHWLDV